MFNPYIVVPFVVWAIAQFLKFIIAAAGGRVDAKYLYGSGGMPSVHSAVVTSLAVTAFLVDGPRSAIFGITTILAAIVMYDSFGVRRSSGEQSVAINAIIAAMDRDRLDHPHLHLREILGHKPLEVAVGALLGFVLACLFNYTRIQGFFDAATTPVTPPYIYVLAGIGALLLIGGVLGRLYYLRKYHKITLIEQLTIKTSWLAMTFGAVGLIIAALQFEKISAAMWALWPALYAIAAVGTAFAISRPYRLTVPQALAEYQASTEKEKWLEGPNKKRRAKAARSKKRK